MFVDTYYRTRTAELLPFSETSMSRNYLFYNINNLLRRNKMIIYKATNKVNNKSYIGQTIRNLHNRKLEHIRSAIKKKSNLAFHNAIRKYGKENFEWEVLCECKNINELNEKEVQYIKEYNSCVNGYNMNDGGDNATHSKETKIKMGQSMKRVWHKHHDFNGKKNPFYEKDHTDEVKHYLKMLWAKRWLVTFPDGNTKTFLGKTEVKQYIIEYNKKNNENVSYHSLFYYGKNGHKWKIKKIS